MNNYNNMVEYDYFFQKTHLENISSECKIIMISSVPYKYTYLRINYSCKEMHVTIWQNILVW